VPRLTQVSASSLDDFRLRACHALWIHFPEDSTNHQIGNSTVADPTTPETPKCHVFSGMYYGFAVVGFPIRKSPDQTPVCGSPKLIAACHVLHRLFLPRHPPCALSSLTIELTLAQQSDLHLRYGAES
jgi:hypothetical protein